MSVVVIRASAGTGHTIRIHHEPTMGDIILKNQKTTVGDTVSLGRQFFDVGSLRIAANFPASIQVDGASVEGETPLAVDRILVGDRELSVNKEGFVVDKVWLVDLLVNT